MFFSTTLTRVHVQVRPLPVGTHISTPVVVKLVALVVEPLARDIGPSVNSSNTSEQCKEHKAPEPLLPTIHVRMLNARRDDQICTVKFGLTIKCLLTDHPVATLQPQIFPAGRANSLLVGALKPHSISSGRLFPTGRKCKTLQSPDWSDMLSLMLLMGDQFKRQSDFQIFKILVEM